MIDIIHNVVACEFHIYHKENNEPVGYCYYTKNPKGYDSLIEIDILKINESYKRKGFGKIFLTKIIQTFKELNYSAIIVLAEPFGSNSKLKLTQDELLNWYGTFGFKVADDIHQYKEVTNDEHVLFLTLV